MTLEKARLLIVEGSNYAAYKETDSSLYDSDKNRLLGFGHYKTWPHIVKTSPWAEGDFEEKMAILAEVGEHPKSFRSLFRASPRHSGRRGFSHGPRHSTHQTREAQ